MNKRVIQRILIGGLAVVTLAGCQRGNNIAQAAREERSLNPNVDNPGKAIPETGGNSWAVHDSDVAYDIESKNLEEVDLAKYVNERTQNADLKSFTNKIIADHSTALAQIRDIIKRQGVNQPATTTPKDELSKTTALRNTPQAEVDSNYLGMMVEEHQQDIDELKADEASVQNSELKKYIQEIIPVMDGHLSQAESLEAKSNKAEKR